MHYSIKNILSKEELDYFINYYDSQEHFITQSMEKLKVPNSDDDFMAVVENLIKNKLMITEKFKIVGDNFYKHQHSYFPHCDATNDRAWLNITIPLKQYEKFGDQKFIVFDQTWGSTGITWIGKTQIKGDFVNNKKNSDRPCDSNYFDLGTGKELPENIWDQFNDARFDRDYFFSMSATVYDWTPGDIIVFDSQHIHATGKMQSKEKLGLSIRTEKI